ncbi:bzz1p [Saccharomyces arboricola H-6]|uniref:Protein BZZ1 n=1 Tax=Saccharomyces arboricola (strain H-6 / AS 2.3317 / CBS 10644) TaxID=1160507 RepID=J8Q1D9_SACAR|nr:bzz1p [Saccharomyces arboricola H-6]
MSADLSIGNEIKDAFKETHKWVQNNLKWLKDIEQFYTERAKLEREYSERLSRLSAEYFNKKSSTSVPISVGDTPTTTPGSVEAAGVVAWNEILSQTDMISKDHNQLSSDFENHVANQLSGLFTKLDMTLSKITGFNNDMASKKDNIYHELEKAKKDYDEACSTMEIARNRCTKASNDRNKKKLNEKEVEMNKCKNEYLIRINQANRTKDKYYFQDVPEVLDLLQDVNEAKTLFLNDLWLKAASVENDLGSRVSKRLESANSVVKQNKPSLNTAIFIKHNLKNWKEPQDFTYKPSPVWHDDEKFAVPSSAEVDDLRIKLAKAENDYNSLQDKAQNELSRLSALNKIKHEMKTNEDKVNATKFYDTLKDYLTVISPFTSHETLKLQAEVQIESIQNNVPEEYDLSTDNIDLSKSKKKSGIFSKLKLNILNVESRPSSGGSTSSGNGGPLHITSLFNTSRRTRLGVATNNNGEDGDNASVHTSGTGDTTKTAQTYNDDGGNKVLYAYVKQDNDEISISPGDKISLVARDTGSGWTKINNDDTGEMGLVPTTYIRISSTAVAAVNGRGPAPEVPPPRRSTLPVRTMEAVYAYEAQGDDEISIDVGDVITVVRGDDGSGWTYGECDGQKGLFPTSYCK